MQAQRPAETADSYNFKERRATLKMLKAGFDKPKDAKLFYTGSMQPRGCYPGGAFKFPRTPRCEFRHFCSIIRTTARKQLLGNLVGEEPDACGRFLRSSRVKQG